MPGTKASTMPVNSSRIAGATLNRRASSAVPASTASRIRNIWNLASTASKPSAPQLARKSAAVNSRDRSLLPQIVAVGFRDDLPAVRELHRHQIVGEIARRQLAAHLDEGGIVVGAVDGHDEILPRLAFGFRRRPLAHPVEPVRYCENLQIALLQPAQIGGRVENGAELLGIALVQAVEIILHH